MEVPWREVLLYLSLLYVIPSLADSACSSSCRGAGGPFLKGNVYKYQLEGSTNTHLPGSSSEVTSLGISATAEVFAESECQHVLKLSNVEVKGPDGKKYDGLSAECAKPVKFSYNEGKLGGLCGEANDRGVALNVKRAVISLLSSIKKEGSSETVYENDVFGICPTDITYSKDGTKLTVHKTRNLNRCALREEFNFPFPTTTYQAVQSSFGAFETSPLLGAQLTVHQELDNGVLQKASGEEHYTYRPLVNPEAGATIKVSYTLTLQGSSPGSIPANVDTPKGVYFELTHDDDGIKNHDTISAALKEATAALDPVATPEAASKFANLIHAIEQGSKADILQAYNAAEGKTAKSLFLDGLLYAGSAESVEAAADLLSSKQIPEESAIRWYLDLNFVKHASRGSLTSLLPLLSGDKVPHQAYLGIGAVAGKFCLEHPGLCVSSPEFSSLVSKLAEPLAAGCKVDSHEKENKIIASLKGLRNTHHLPDDVAQKVSQCAGDKTAKTRVRVAAIEAFHADASKPLLKEQATSILKDVDEDSELRIKAYLALVEAPCPKVADTIKDLIDNEPINQVGAYIVSHLRNLRASISPEKEAAKQFFGNIISKKKFPIDQRKFSRNYEVSYSLDALNMGAVGEVNRIFSQKSFIPRSVSLNLTTQLFGHSINLAEIGLRAENLEWHLEKYFGPKGVFKTKGAKFFDEAVDKAHDALKKAKEQAEANRPKRSVSKQEADAATSKVQLGPDYEDHDTDLDLSVKLFGSDIAWMNYHHNNLDYENLKNRVYGKMEESLDKSKSIDIDYKKARNFLDGGVTYPTGLGFGLKVNVKGNSAVNIKVNGKIDLKAIMNNPQNAHVAFQVVPSANIELTSLIAIDANVVETGVKVSANLHSSTGTDLTVKVLDGFGVDVKLGLPIKKQEILNFHSDVVSVVREKKSAPVESPIKFNVKRQEHGGCFDQLSSVSGLIFCGEVSVPMEGFKMLSPAYGPSKASIRLEKEDESLTAYHFKAYYDNKQADQVTLEVLLDTPNSKTNRKFSLNVQGSTKPQKQLLVIFTSPFKSATFEGLVVDTENEQALSAKLVSDNSEYSFKVGAHVSGDANHKKYEPLLEYKYPDAVKTERAWIGRKGAAKGKGQQATLGVTGAVIVDKTPGTQYRKYELKAVTLSTPRLKLTVDGTITIDSNLVATDLKATYEKDTFTLNSKIQKLEDHKYIAKIEFAPSQYPDLGGSIKWEYERSPQKIENKLVVVHGPDLKSETSRLSLTQLLKYKYESVKAFDFHTENTVTYPLLGISASMKGGVSPKSVEYDIDVSYEKSQMKSKLDAKAGAKHPTDYSIDFEAKALGNSVDFTSKHERVSPTKSKFTNSLELKPGGKYQLNSICELSVKPGDVYQSLDLEVKMPQDPKIVKVKTELKHNSKEDEVEFKLSAGNKHIVDFEFDLEKKAEPSGKYKLSLPKYVDSQGIFETKDGKVTGSFHVNILKTGRKIEGTGELTKTPTHIKGSGDILWDAKKDPSKKVHVETDTEYSEKSIDTKNSIQVLEYKTDVNVKGNLEGAYTDGTLVGDVEVVLPTGRILAAKVNRVAHLAPEDNKIEGTWELFEYASKGAQPRKVTLKVAGKNINPVKVQFDGQVDLTYVTPNNDDIVLHVVGKKMPQGDKWTISGQGSVTGSMVPRPLHTKLSAEVAEQLLKWHLTPDKKFPPGHYDFELKSGSDIAISSNGKINQDQLNNDIELSLPADLPIKSFKWHTVNNFANLFGSEGSLKKVVTKNEVHWNGDKFIKSEYEAVLEGNEVSAKAITESHNLPACTSIGKVSSNKEETKGTFFYSTTCFDGTYDVTTKYDLTSNPLHLHVVANIPKQGKFEIDGSHKVSDGGETRETSITAIRNNEKFVYSSHYSFNKKSPYVDVSLEIPDGKTRFYAKVDKKEEKHMLVESKINWFTNGGGYLDMNGEFNLKSLDDFYVKMFIDSPKLNWNKVEFEAANKQTKSADKSITFHGKSAEKEFSGSLNLVSKGTAPNIDYEGKGVLKIGETNYPLEFKMKHELEKGRRMEGNIELKAGKYSYVSHTLSEYDEAAHLYRLDSSAKYCKEAECRSRELKFSYHRQGLNYEMSSEFKLDLASPLMDHPLLFKSHCKKEGWHFDSNIDIEYGPEKLQYHGYIKEDHAGVELTCPKRVIAGELVYEIAKGKKPASARIEANFWLDKKNNANDKTSLLLTTETTNLPDGLVSSSEARFNTPGLKEMAMKGELNVNAKDHVVNAKLEADVFAKKNQKLVAEYKAVGKKDKDSYSSSEHVHVHSKGLNIEFQVERKISLTKNSVSYSLTGFYLDSKQAKREAVAKLSADPKSFHAQIKIPEGTLYLADVSVERGDKQVNLKGTYEILGYQFEEEGEVKGTHMKIKHIHKGTNEQLDIEFGFVVGQVAEISGKFNQKPLLSLEVALDEAHFLKSKHSYNTDTAKELVKFAKETGVGMVKEASKIFKETGAKIAHEITDKTEDCRKALPNFKPAVSHYQKELQQIKEELTSNKNVKDVIDYIKNTFGIILSHLNAVLQQITNTSDRLVTLWNEAIQKVTASVKETIPKLKESYEKASEILIKLLDDALKYATSAFNIVMDKIKEHEKEIQELTTIVTDFVHDVGQMVAKTVSEVQREVKDFVNVLWDQIQALPVYNMLKEKLQELKNYKIPEQYWETYHDLVLSAEQLLPTPELQTLLKSAADVFEKLVKHQPINKSEVLQQLYKEFIAALRSVVAIIEAHKPADSKAEIPTNFYLPTPSLSLLVAPPGTFRFSLLNWVRSSDLPTLSEIYHTYRPTHSPLDVIPPFRASAQLIGGTEFFTFDRKHYSFKGSCSYILSKDVIDANFTVVANMEAGKLKSITVFDHQNSIELLHDDNALLNGKPTDLPIHEGDLHLWRNFDSGTGFATHSGLMFYCTPQLKICAFGINGFYFGKTRGLLGTYNNEPYDDTTVPEGKNAKSLSEFANSWKVSPQCGDGAVHEQPAPPAEECTKLFSGDSNLRRCFAFENPDHYREACNRQVAEASGEAKHEKACNIASSYVGYCFYVHFVRTQLPDHCGKCQVGSQSLHIGESTPVKLPQKEADVVFVIEESHENEEVFNNLITPLISTLTNDLKEKGITDVNYALVGYSLNRPWPSVYTFNGKYDGFTGTAKNLHFDAEPEVTEPKFSDKLKELKERIMIETGMTVQASAFREAFNYPFRPEALQTVVAVVSSGCKQATAALPFQTLRLLMHRLNLLNAGLVTHLVTPLADLKIEGKDEKTAANIVGFDSESVYTQSEAKRKVLKGDEETLKNLKYTSDICVDLTLGVNGAVFSSTNFVKGKPSLRKNFLQVLSHKVTDSLTSEEVKKECKCELERGMLVRTRCKIISRKEKESVKGVKG